MHCDNKVVICKVYSRNAN